MTITNLRPSPAPTTSSVRPETGVSIVIPNWNGRALLEKFLPSVLAAARHYERERRAPVQILVIDDASTDKSVEYLQQQGFQQSGSGSKHPALELVRNEGNLGFGLTCNRGFATARYGLVLLLNNDVQVAPDAIAPLVEHFAKTDVFAVHCRVFELESGQECGRGQLGSFSRGFLRVHRSYSPRADSGQSVERLYSIFASGGSAMFDRQKFMALGGFDPLFKPMYWEDVEISYRAWKRGYVVLYEPQSVVHHRVSSTMRTVDPGMVRRTQQRNRLILHWIHLHDRGYMARHITWVIVLATTAPLRLQFGFLRACGAALPKLKEIRRRRAEEKRLAKRSDREVLEIFRELWRRPAIEAK
jgi:GT2 family glycosyltransferase